MGRVDGPYAIQAFPESPVALFGGAFFSFTR